MKVETAVPQAQPRNEKVDQVSKLYEKQFLREMVRAMRKTVDEDGLLKPNMAEKIFREQLDDEYVEKWGDNGGIGLSDLIYEQVMQRYFQGAQVAKPKGPLPMSSGPMQFRATENGDGVRVKINRAGPAQPQSSQLMSPWPGRVTESQTWDEGLRMLKIQHDNGMQSKFIFGGRALKTTGEQLNAGEMLGDWDPNFREFYWEIS